jgi:hypothetical protein
MEKNRKSQCSIFLSYESLYEYLAWAAYLNWTVQQMYEYHKSSRRSMTPCVLL